MRQNRSRYGPEPENSNGPMNYAKIALIGAVFIVGLVVGIVFSSTTSTNTASIDSSIEVDRQAPNPALCQEFGASAMVTNMRVFITLRPFNVFVTQPSIEPGCVLRQSGMAILQQKNLINSKEMNQCKRRMNTFGFTGPLEGKPEIECIYKNDAAGNLFMNGEGVPAPGADSDIY